MIRSHTSDYIVAMVDAAYENLSTENAIVHLAESDLFHFRQEFGTIRINMPRRFGHTTAAITLLHLYPGSLLFTPSYTTRNRTLQEFRNFKLGGDIIQRRGLDNDHDFNLTEHLFGPMPRDELLRKINTHTKRPMIIMDQASTMSQHSKDEIDRTYTERTALFVELQ